MADISAGAMGRANIVSLRGAGLNLKNNFDDSLGLFNKNSKKGGSVYGF
jgi:hypothetical protein